MSLTSSICVICFVFCNIFTEVVGQFCKEDDQPCPDGLSCCGITCCARENYYHGFRWNIWNMWYFWFIVIFILMSCFGGCGYWRRRQLMMHQQQSFLTHQQAYNNFMHEATFNVPSHPIGPFPQYATSNPPPATVQPEGSFPAPPPYSEVTKPGYYCPNKEELPPYSQHAYPTMMSPNTAEGGSGVLPSDGMVPGLPPYTGPSVPTQPEHRDAQTSSRQDAPADTSRHQAV